MSWETRNGRGRYYTRSHRVHGRIVREYIGTGETAELIAARDAAARAERDAERAALRDAKAAARALDAELAGLHRTVDLLTRGALLAAGYERHKRQWRMRRGQVHRAGQA